METHLFRSRIRAHFNGVHQPLATELVEDDGFDVLDKQLALKHFRGKSWQDHLEYLRSIENHETLGAAYMLEEWSVLQPTAIIYYSRAFLEHLLDLVELDDPDESYISAFFSELYQIIHSRGHELMSNAQVETLRYAANCITERIWAPSLDPEFGPTSALLFISELDSRRCE